MPELDLSLLVYGLVVGMLAGTLGGVMAGLAGVGGGLIYMPVFYAFMPGDTNHVAVHVFASLVAVIITGFFSARTHWRLGHVDMQLLKRLLPGLIIGAMLGLWCTLRLPEVWVLLALASLYGWVAVDYGRKQVGQQTSVAPVVLFSGPVGFASGALGIAGGTMLVPLLRRFVALRMAVGTSSVCGLLMVLAAVSGNMLFEPGWYGVLEGQLPFLVAAWLGVLLVIPVVAGRSARLHESVSEQWLRVVLKLIFTVLAIGLLIAAALA